MTNIDLRLLEIIGELSRTRSVSQTAENLNLSQSAVSMSLAKLRRHFNDPLFVRTSAGMEPTPHATGLISLLQQAEGLLHTALGHHVVFDPETTDRKFRIHSTDITQATLMPRLMIALREAAPNATIRLGRISDQTARHLESGDVDLAIGAVEPMGAGFCQQRLFRERFVCLARRDHPRIGATLTKEQFTREEHVASSAQGAGHEFVGRALGSESVTRRVGLVVPSYLGVAPLVASSDYLAMVPEQLGLYLADTHNVKVLELPFEIPGYVVGQHWHERYTQDPSNRWLRSIIAQLFTPVAPLQTEPDDQTSTVSSS